MEHIELIMFFFYFRGHDTVHKSDEDGGYVLCRSMEKSAGAEKMDFNKTTKIPTALSAGE